MEISKIHSLLYFESCDAGLDSEEGNKANNVKKINVLTNILVTNKGNVTDFISKSSESRSISSISEGYSSSQSIELESLNQEILSTNSKSVSKAVPQLPKRKWLNLVSSTKLLQIIMK